MEKQTLTSGHRYGHNNSLPCHCTWHQVEVEGQAYGAFVITFEDTAPPENLVVLVEADAFGRPAVVRGEQLAEAVRSLPNDELAIAVARMIAARGES